MQRARCGTGEVAAAQQKQGPELTQQDHLHMEARSSVMVRGVWTASTMLSVYAAFLTATTTSTPSTDRIVDRNHAEEADGAAFPLQSAESPT